MTPKKGYHVAPVIRRAFLKALDIEKSISGKTLPELLHGEIQEHGLLYVMERVGKYVERDRHVTGTVEHKHAGSIEHVGVSEVDRFLAEATGGETPRPDEGAVPH